MRKKTRAVGRGTLAASRIPPGKSAPNTSFSGYVEAFGYSYSAGGWLFNCWIQPIAKVGALESVDFLVQFEDEQCWGNATLAFFQREGPNQKSMGVVAFMPAVSQSVGALQHVAFSLNGARYQPQSGDFTARLLDQEIVESVRSNLLNKGYESRNRDQLLALTARAAFSGQDTLQTLSETVWLEVDEAILCPPGGVFLKGCYLSSWGAVRHVRLRSGPLATEIVWADAIRMDRPDVIREVGPKWGFTDTRCGFMIYVAGAVSSGNSVYFEIELLNGEVGFKAVKISKRTGIDAIRRILAEVEAGFGEIDAAFDKTIGPAVNSINAARRQVPPAVKEVQFGTSPPRPLCSVIIPLYGRVDYVEFQMALFSAAWDVKQTEVLYVLDDPAKRRELEVLARSVYERFGIPFRLLMLDINVGFAGANNIGLAAARGQYICFLNSDIFPITPKWLERLVTRLKQKNDIGIIGARLLFEDGSVQHEGCYYRTLREFGDWTFVEHLNKGRRPQPDQGLQRRDAITGACMVLKRSLAEELGGFDEAYVIGDFEDSDLCLKAKAKGLGCAVDMGVHMHHLERQSQSSSEDAWRMNLTLYNAWVHQRRWFGPNRRALLAGTAR